MRPADTLIARLSGVKVTGKGRWMAKCPAHEDGSPSLSIREMDDGRLLIYDFGGCGSLEVLGALGLSLTDLFAERLTHCAPPLRSSRTRPTPDTPPAANQTAPARPQSHLDKASPASP